MSDIPSAWKGLEGFAHWLVLTLNPKITVELGTDYGYSAIELARYNKGIVYTVDWFKGDEHTGFRDTEAKVRQNLDESGILGVQLIKHDFHSAAESWTRGVIDLLHIDGRHNYEDVRQDFNDWIRHVRSGGVILLHDTQSFANDVGRFYHELVYPKFEITHSHGLGVVLKT